MSEVKIREIALKIGKTLEYLHDNGIILRNLESSSILMSYAGLVGDEDNTHTPRIAKLDKA